MQWFEANEWVGWMALALALAAVEAATVDFLFIMLAGGALAASLAAALGAPFALQVVIACVVAVALIGVLRPILTRRFLVPAIRLGADARVGRTATVLSAVSGHGGRVKLSGEEWSARLISSGASNPEPPTVPAGATVYVHQISGATVLVSTHAPASEATPAQPSH